MSSGLWSFGPKRQAPAAAAVAPAHCDAHNEDAHPSENPTAAVQALRALGDIAAGCTVDVEFDPSAVADSFEESYSFDLDHNDDGMDTVGLAMAGQDQEAASDHTALEGSERSYLLRLAAQHLGLEDEDADEVIRGNPAEPAAPTSVEATGYAPEAYLPAAEPLPPALDAVHPSFVAPPSMAHLPSRAAVKDQDEQDVRNAIALARSKVEAASTVDAVISSAVSAAVPEPKRRLTAPLMASRVRSSQFDGPMKATAKFERMQADDEARRMRNTAAKERIAERERLRKSDVTAARSLNAKIEEERAKLKSELSRLRSKQSDETDAPAERPLSSSRPSSGRSVVSTEATKAPTRSSSAAVRTSSQRPESSTTSARSTPRASSIAPSTVIRASSKQNSTDVSSRVSGAPRRSVSSGPSTPRTGSLSVTSVGCSPKPNLKPLPAVATPLLQKPVAISPAPNTPSPSPPPTMVVPQPAMEISGHVLLSNTTPPPVVHRGASDTNESPASTTYTPSGGDPSPEMSMPQDGGSGKQHMDPYAMMGHTTGMVVTAAPDVEIEEELEPADIDVVKSLGAALETAGDVVTAVSTPAPAAVAPVEEAPPAQPTPRPTSAATTVATVTSSASRVSMTERLAERAEARRLARMEIANRHAAKEQQRLEEEAKRIAEAERIAFDEKKLRARKIRELRRHEEEKKLRKEQQATILEEKLNVARHVCQMQCVKIYGFLPWKQFVKQRHETYEFAAAHHGKILLAKAMVGWKAHVVEAKKVHRVASVARCLALYRFLQHAQKRHCFQHWRRIIAGYRCDERWADKHYATTMLRRMKTAVQRVEYRRQWYRDRQEVCLNEIADRQLLRRTKMTAIRTWHRRYQAEDDQRERERYRNRLQSRIADLLQ